MSKHTHRPPDRHASALSSHLFLIAGILLSILAVPAAIWLFNNEHPNILIILFPGPAFLSRNFKGQIIALGIFTACQFPLYGYLADYSRGIRQLRGYAIGLTIAHAIIMTITLMDRL